MYTRVCVFLIFIEYLFSLLDNRRSLFVYCPFFVEGWGWNVYLHVQTSYCCLYWGFYSYIEFYDAMSVPMAIALCGQLLLGQPVMVKPSEAEKNLVQSNATGAAARKIYVGNLHFNITEDQLRQVNAADG